MQPEKARRTYDEPNKGVRSEDRYGDVYVNTKKSKETYRWWLAITRPGPVEGGFRRPEVFDRPYRPDREVFFVKE